MLRAVSQSFPIPPGYTGQVQPYVLARSGIPFISLSSGSVSAVGAITGITALVFTYARAYCYFPANILATSIAAGWYYCTFSNTTTGTAFLDTYTSGIPSIPSSPTAVTDGKGAFTGDTGEEFGPTITVPANALGANGVLRDRHQYTFTNNANVKTVNLRYSGNAGTTFLTNTYASQSFIDAQTVIVNRGVTNSQYGYSTQQTGSGAGGQVGRTTSSVDTTGATTIVHSLQKATATDNATLECFVIELLYGA